MSLVDIFATAILPIIALTTVGFVLGRRREINVAPLNTITINVLVPALIFHSLATTELSGSTLASVVVGVVLFTGVMAIIAEGTGRLLGETEPILGTLVLVSVFSNAGNYGIPVSEFAFGAIGRSTAVIYIVAQAVVIYTGGVYLAARGEGENWRSGLRAIFEIPLVYTVAAALLARYVGIVPPAETAVMETLKLVGDSSIPVMLLILGIELAAVNYGTAIRRVAPAVALKMLLAPVVAVAVALLIDFTNPTVARVFVLECSMPAAVTTLILTGEFSGPVAEGMDATEFAGTVIFVSTVLSVPLLTGIIALLQSGIIF